MTRSDTTEVREFLYNLAQYPFLLKDRGIDTTEDARRFINESQEEEPVYEAFLYGLIRQSIFYPVEPEVWVEMARRCNFNHPAILDKSSELPQGGPVSEWYIYPKLLRWLLQHRASEFVLNLTEDDQKFLSVYGYQA